MIEIGIAGAIVLLIAWLFETVKSVAKHKALVDVKFAGMYVIGTSLLTLYAYLKSDYVFLALNACLLALVLFEVIYTVKKGLR
jgi:lipid-A-disaccharide synthase-like uncharacterized protein